MAFVFKKDSQHILGYLSLTAASLALASFYLAGVGAERTPISRFAPVANATGLPLALPEGFSISIYARGLDNPQAMIWDRNGAMLVASEKKGTITVVRDTNRDGIADSSRVIAKKLKQPNGLSLECGVIPPLAYLDARTKEFSGGTSTGSDCTLFVSTADAIVTYEYRKDTTSLGTKSVFADTTESTEEGFFGRTAMADESFGYCRDPDPDRQAIISKFCNPGGQFFEEDSAKGSAVAIPDNGWPAEYRQNVLVAYAGTSNYGNPTGHKIVRYKFDEKGNFQGQEDFMSGWRSGQRSLGSPTDLLIGPDSGSYISDLYIADGLRGFIYRVSYRGSALLGQQ